ncbi:NAD(P)-binding protein [Actimicrobium sp. CCI2.3]|uniref:NAD(P)-binding protein n=1 Tax=Actimicrobium sp. CCI2.3 TaxID=3048616 RepID=UPI002AB526D0|nr:NAD(P)-binding protein [Actimicrobium sp. CCI2.3]MDY7574903.1 NAD(P)-binding protein [Actimicrobium sp. CCI2.3]MEB0023366.1 NAD(P)-binding protein [Actimicrobium sp. CCI2.3]
MDRRSFLMSGGIAGAALLAGGAGFRGWQEIDARINHPGRTDGHFLRDRRALPPASELITTDVVILGSGVAGLTAAWKMNKAGHKNFLMIDGPQPYGNAAGGRFGELAYPTGGHYLPLPSPESSHVREILSDLGIILRNPMSESPYYDERLILHAPEERLLFNGVWQNGFIPTEGVAQEELDEHTRFFAEVERLRNLHGGDGKRIFVFPTVLSSTDPQWHALDQITLKDWLDQNGYRSPTLHWYLNYCCRDDYGRRYDQISAWAGLHYYCSRWGQAENSGKGAWLTWAGGLHTVAEAMDKAAGNRRKPGTAVSLKTTADGVEALCFELVNGVPHTYLVRARKAICAMPLYVAARVVQSIKEYGFDPALHLPDYAPWMVSNFLMKDFPVELPHAPLSWDNVVYQEPGLGYVVSTHQDIRVALPGKTVFSAYRALSDQTPDAARKWLDTASPDDLLELACVDLKAAYGWKFAPCVERVEMTLRGHAMAVPSPGFRTNMGLKALRELDGPILFAHGDLSGFSVFEEAAWWGYRAGQLSLT